MKSYPWIVLVALTCSACSNQQHRQSVANAREPSPPTDREARQWLSAQLGHVISRRSVELDGRAPREWVLATSTSTQREASLAFAQWNGARWTLIAVRSAALGEQGTFELEAGYGLQPALRSDDGRELVVTERIEAQGAVDPRTITRELEAFAWANGTVERVLRCRLGFTVVTGPEREEESGVQWSFVDANPDASTNGSTSTERSPLASIELTDQSRRASLRWTGRGWTGIEPLRCDVSRERL